MTYTGTSIQSPEGLFQVAVCANGVRLPIFFDPAQSRHFVAGTPGQNYYLQVQNLRPARIEVLVAIDGRSIFEDAAGDLNANRGMALRPNQTWDCKGFRLSDDAINEFLFGTPAGSIEHQATGSTDNTGVIGLAGYRESVPIQRSMTRGISGQSMGAAVASASAGGLRTNTAERSSLGTHMGETVDDHVGRTEFARQGSPVVITIGYDLEDVLAARGILGPALPEPFPGAGTGYKSFTQG